MSGEMEILHDAREVVAAEQTAVRREIDAFTEFRDAISHTHPVEETERQSEQTREIVQAYEETVLAESNFGITAEAALESSLELEFSEHLAETLLSSEPFTNRLKRKLLVQTSTLIDRRTSLQGTLEGEADSLATATGFLCDVASDVRDLPPCTVRNTSLEELLETWERYDELEARCERLLENRQNELNASSRRVSTHAGEHALCWYLYGGLETTYPVLSAVADVCERIRVARNESQPRRNPV